jgi:adenylate cyclase
MGDGILAFFGAPLYADDDPERAVACAIEMQNEMVAVNTEQRHLKLPELAMGIGINTGEVVVGNIGSEHRASYGAVGTPINAAYRIESFTVGGQILISPGTYEKVQSRVSIIGTKEVKFKGLDQPVCLYDVGGIGDPYQVFLPEKEAVSLTRLNSPLPIECFLVEGKTVSETAIDGRITHLAGNEAAVILDEQLSDYTNLRIVLASSEARGLSELYAKVLPQDKAEDSASEHRAQLQFTSIPQDTKEFLDQRQSEG